MCGVYFVFVTAEGWKIVERGIFARAAKHTADAFQIQVSLRGNMAIAATE